MRAKQRESILVLVNGLDGDIPSIHGVALFTACSHLAAVNIGVAVGTMMSDIGEHQANVALSALDILVQTAQWIAGFVVIEFRKVAYGFPAGEAMTIRTLDA